MHWLVVFAGYLTPSSVRFNSNLWAQRVGLSRLSNVAAGRTVALMELLEREMVSAERFGL